MKDSRVRSMNQLEELCIKFKGAIPQRVFVEFLNAHGEKDDAEDVTSLTRNDSNVNMAVQEALGRSDVDLPKKITNDLMALRTGIIVKPSGKLWFSQKAAMTFLKSCLYEKTLDEIVEQGDATRELRESKDIIASLTSDLMQDNTPSMETADESGTDVGKSMEMLPPKSSPDELRMSKSMEELKSNAQEMPINNHSITEKLSLLMKIHDNAELLPVDNPKRDKLQSYIADEVSALLARIEALIDRELNDGSKEEGQENLINYMHSFTNDDNINVDIATPRDKTSIDIESLLECKHILKTSHECVLYDLYLDKKEDWFSSITKDLESEIEIFENVSVDVAEADP